MPEKTLVEQVADGFVALLGNIIRPMVDEVVAARTAAFDNALRELRAELASRETTEQVAEAAAEKYMVAYGLDERIEDAIAEADLDRKVKDALDGADFDALVKNALRGMDATVTFD